MTKTIAETGMQQCIEPDCGKRYKLSERLYVCAQCGGLLEIRQPVVSTNEAKQLREVWERRLASHDERDMSGVWRYRELLPFADDAKVVSLREGNTPLYEAPRAAQYGGLDRLKLKHQGCNPTGSFKDVGMTVAVTQAIQLGAETLVCASTGNTAASLAAYAARANLQCAILVPHGGISDTKLAQSLDYGAAVLELDGNFDDAMRVIRDLGEDPSIYLVNSINPFRIEGQKTVAFELMQQLRWHAPDHVVVPGGNLGNSAALGKGFRELFDLRLIDRLPRLSVVQAEGAAPLARYFADYTVDGKSNPPKQHAAGRSFVFDTLLAPVAEPRTLATAIKIGAPVSWKKALRHVMEMNGRVLSVTEAEIADAKAIIGRDGIGCEPASATTVAGIRRLVAEKFIKPDENTVAVLTGHVMKDADYTINYHRGTLREHTAEAGAGHSTFIKSAYPNPPARVEASKIAILNYLQRDRN